MEIEFSLDYLAKADNSATQLSLEAAKSQGIADSLKESGKDLLASIMNRIAMESRIKSNAELERCARATDEWESFRVGQLEAIKDALVLKVRASNAERHWETIRTGISYKKEEMKRGVA